MSTPNPPEVPEVPERPLPRRRPELVPVVDGPVRASAYVCEAVSCLSAQSHEVLTGLGIRLSEAGATDVAIKRVGCLGLCAAGPLVQIPETGELFAHVRPDGLDSIVDALAAVRPGSQRVAEAAFFTGQMRIATENSGRVDPESLEDYVESGGYGSLRKALTTMAPTDVREEITRSGLRGRGGAGYPTGLKWNTVAKADGTPQYVICNADEGDPGAFMDRSVLESDPYRVLEGMAIAAYAVGATEGYVYCRAEYPLAVSRLRKAIRDAGKAGYLGAGILDTAVRVPGGRRAWAQARSCAARRQPSSHRSREDAAHPGHGRHTRPSRDSGDAPRSSTTWRRSPTSHPSSAMVVTGSPAIGTATSKGTKVFALAGRVVNTGLIEVPMGTPLREIVFDIGGGIVDGRAFKAVQTGGPSGGCIPPSSWTRPWTTSRSSGSARSWDRAA